MFFFNVLSLREEEKPWAEAVQRSVCAAPTSSNRVRLLLNTRTLIGSENNKPD